VLLWFTGWCEVQMICIWSSWCHCHPIISCFVKIQNGSAFMVPAYPGYSGKGPLNWYNSSSQYRDDRSDIWPAKYPPWLPAVILISGTRSNLEKPLERRSVKQRLKLIVVVVTVVVLVVTVKVYWNMSILQILFHSFCTFHHYNSPYLCICDIHCWFMGFSVRDHCWY